MDIPNKNSSIKYFLLLVTLLLLITGGVAIAKYRTGENLERQLNDVYTRSFLQLVDCVNDIDTSLSKGIVSNSPTVLNDLSNEIYRKATFAQANLGELPISHIEIDNTAKFLSQVGDYTYSLAQKSLRGETISTKEKDQMENLSKYASTLTDTLYSLQNELYSGNLSFNISKSANEAIAKENKTLDIGSSMEDIEKDFEEYPALIYDGPFSDHINKMSSKLLKNSNNVTRAHAQSIASEFLGNPEKITFRGEGNANIKTYIFSATASSNDDAYIEITKQGGRVLYMLKNRNVVKREISINDAIKKGAETLKKHKFYSMKESYWEIGNNIATINYAYVQDNIVMYPDLVKVKVALDNGEILGFECQGYIMAHQDERLIGNINLTIDEAKAKISGNIEIVSQGMAYIPKDDKTEVLCYEFKGKFNDKTYLIYVNAETGNEEKILILVESQEGTLTI
ncbi:MAG: germination protein YpeB [Ruminococcaceae bacterium]|nr:germination protein YpeB [Oscillospiraceae bacterium]